MPSAHRQQATIENKIFWAYLALLIWLPFPFGSDRGWAASIMEAWVFLLSAAWLWGYFTQQYKLPSIIHQSRHMLYLLTLWLAYLCLQITPLPLTWLQAISPFAAKAHASQLDSAFGTISVDPHVSKIALLKSISYTLLFLLTLLLVNTSERIKALAYTLVLCGAFQAAYGSLMVLTGIEYTFFTEKIRWRGIAVGTLDNRNLLAGYLNLCLAAGIGLLMANLGSQQATNWRQRSRNFVKLLLSSKLRLRLLLAVMVVGLVMTHSRMGNTAFFSSLLVAGGLSLLLARKKSRSMIILFSSLVVIDLFIVGAWFGVDKVVKRLESTSLGHENRDEIASYAMDMFNNNLLTGTGNGTFYTAFEKYRGENFQAYYGHAMNDYLEFASTTGIIGLLILAAIVLLSLYNALHALRHRKQALMRGIAFASLMATCTLLLHSSTDYNLQIPATASVLMVLLALGVISNKSNAGQQRKSSDD